MQDLSDWMSTRWVLAQIPDLSFEQLSIRCHSCRKHDPGDCADPIIKSTRRELAEGGARVILYGEQSCRGEQISRWDICLPFTTYGQWLMRGHLFHLLEAEWDHRWVSTKPLWVQSLSECAMLPLPSRGPLPTGP